MTCSDAQDRLDAWLDGLLATPECRAVEAHVHACAHCRAHADELRVLRECVSILPRQIAPARDLWPDVRAAIDADTSAVENLAILRRQMRIRWTVAAAAAALLMVCGVSLYRRLNGTPPAWTVDVLAGALRVGDSRLVSSGRWHEGQWLETDESARAQFMVGNIGEVRLEPNSRLRLLRAEETDHRVELVRGTMHALIWAPPRLFFVETGAGTAIDLGCAYTLRVGDDGVGLLEVTSGYVALEKAGRSSVVPAGMLCRLSPATGPGTPFAIDAGKDWREWLEKLDDGETSTPNLRLVLAGARHEDAITLWHLLTRVVPGQRGMVFDSLRALEPPPEPVTRSGIVDGDAAMLASWGVELGLAVAFDNPISTRGR